MGTGERSAEIGDDTDLDHEDDGGELDSANGGKSSVRDILTWKEAIGMIIETNMQAGRIPDDGFLLLAEAPYHEIGVDRARAELKSRFLSEFAADVIRIEFPKLAEKMHVRTAVLAWQTRAMEMIDGCAA